MTLVLIALVVGMYLYYIYVKKFKPLKDEVKGTDTQLVYVIASQFVDPHSLNASFTQIYNEALDQDFPHLNPRVRALQLQTLFKCMRNHKFAVEVLQAGVGTRDQVGKANLVAMGINLAMYVDSSDYFARGLRVHSSEVAERYKEILHLWNLSNAQIKEAFLHPDVTSSPLVAPKSVNNTTVSVASASATTTTATENQASSVHPTEEATDTVTATEASTKESHAEIATPAVVQQELTAQQVQELGDVVDVADQRVQDVADSHTK